MPFSKLTTTLKVSPTACTQIRKIIGEGEIVCCRDIYPLLRGVKEFQAALDKLEA